MSFHAARLATEKRDFRPLLPSVIEVGHYGNAMNIQEQISHPSWQRKRLEIMEAAGWECENCGASDTQLHVHHKHYVKGRKYWDYSRDELACLCKHCHKAAHEAQDGIKELLTDTVPSMAFGFIAGYHHAADWVDKETVAAGRKTDALSYAAGVVGWMVSNLDIDDIKSVAEYVSSISGDHSDNRMIFTHDQHIFGGDR